MAVEVACRRPWPNASSSMATNEERNASVMDCRDSAASESQARSLVASAMNVSNVFVPSTTKQRPNSMTRPAAVVH
jgi:hypothetical protein